jgi:hypothetical protein
LLGVGPAAAVTLTVSPASGPPGTEIVVTGTGFAALPVEIRWGGLSGPVIATATGPDFSVTATVPDSQPNSVPVLAVVTNGNSVSTSSASFQVTSGDAPAAPAETSTTTTVAEPPTTTPTASVPGGEVGQSPIRGGPARDSGLGGGVDGGVDAAPAAGTTNGAGATASPSAGSSSATVTSAPTTVPSVAAAEVTTPTVTVAPVLPTVQSAAAVPLAPGEGVAAGVVDPARTSQSAGAISNPALLFVGLGLVFGGGVFLAVRNRQRS